MEERSGVCVQRFELPFFKSFALIHLHIVFVLFLCNVLFLSRNNFSILVCCCHRSNLSVQWLCVFVCVRDVRLKRFHNNSDNSNDKNQKNILTSYVQIHIHQGRPICRERIFFCINGHDFRIFEVIFRHFRLGTIDLPRILNALKCTLIGMSFLETPHHHGRDSTEN